MTQRARPRRGSIFAVPAALALATLVGLIAGVVGDGAADRLSWAALTLPLAAIAWAVGRRRRG